MKKHSLHYLILFVFCLTAITTSAQSAYMGWGKPLKAVETSMPSFPEGEKALRKYIEDNLVYPQSAIDAEIQGNVTVKFAIAPTGEIVNIRIAESLHYACDSAVVEMVRAMPKWIPVNEDRISDEFTLPIIFSLPYDYNKDGEKVYRSPQQMPSYPEGETAMQRYIAENLRYPHIGCCSIQGRVTVRFIVTKEGKVTDIKIIRGIDKGLDSEAFRVIESMPDWIPAMHEGEKVHAYFTLPVVFRLK